MTTPSAPLKASDIQTEFGGSNPISISEYYRGGALVPAGTGTSPVDGTPISTSGLIRWGMFRQVAATVNVNLTISANTTNYNIFTAAGSPSTVANVTVTINSGVFVYSTNPGSPALDTGTGWVAGSTITVINNGSIIGAGGFGAYTGSNGNVGSLSVGARGGNGGDALRAQYAVAVTNNGTIAGGGGGGGAGANIDGAVGGGNPANYGGNGNGGTGVAFPSSGGAGAGTASLNQLTNGSTSNGSTTGATYVGTNGTNGANNAGSTGVIPLGFTGITSSGGGGSGQASGGGAGGALGGWGGSGGPVYNQKYGFGAAPGGYPGNYVVGNSNVTWNATGTRVGRVDNAFANGHGVRLLTSQGILAVTATTPTSATATVTFNTDGTISLSGTGSNNWNLTDNWRHPTSAGIGSSYWIRCTATTGAFTNFTFVAPSPSAGTGTWLALSSARTWGITQAAVGKTGCQLLFEIASDAAGSNIVASGLYFLKAYRSA